MRHIRLTIQYVGTGYAGWQVQRKETTIQGVLEDTLLIITKEHQRITGAARTDAGVHALEQVAAFKTKSDLHEDIFSRAFNANLPLDIRVIDAKECTEDFHPRYSAKYKQYSYIVSQSRSFSVFLNRFSWQLPYHLNRPAMRESAKHLTGVHDFSSFRAAGCSSTNSVREIKNIEISEFDSIDFLGFTLNAPVIKISIQANAFLRHMVRTIVGTLAEIGRGKIPPEKMKEILEAKDRRIAGKTAPACGLFLEKIVYENTGSPDHIKMSHP